MKSGYCSICGDRRRAEFDRAYIAGASIREVAKMCGHDKSTVQRHIPHIGSAAQRAIATAAARDTDHGDAIVAEVAELRDSAKRLLAKAEARKDYRTAVSAVRELARLVELKARLLGELRDREINITNVRIDADTAARMATMYLARSQRRTITAGMQPVGSMQVAEDEPEE